MTIGIISILTLHTLVAQAPKKDKGQFVDKKNEFWEKVQRENRKYAADEKKEFIVDFSGMDLPKSKDEFVTYWHNDPVSQGNSGMCWSFSTTSFYESEIFRRTGRKVKLSELHTVYWEYVEKARRYVQTLGSSLFEQGSMANHVPIIWEKYGVVPADVYTGLQKGEPFHNHTPLFAEIKSYLQHVKEHYIWDEETVLATIKAILNKHLGEPPAVIKIDGKEMTPMDYFQSFRIDFDDYVDVLSLMEQPYHQFVLYPVPDNWWKSEAYYNVPLDEFMSALKSALRRGYTICIGGDTSEAGYYSFEEVAVVPTFDIPSDYIDENARQLRFSNGSTTDDHGVHIVGFLEKDGQDWFLVKDSGAGAQNGPNEGYYFYHQDYIKLKMMDFTVCKEALTGTVDF
ncbi:peptidase C1 [candidate division KSB1 bacterium]|nr:peptidase C1 [candidate division KSB1 bacterium]RQW06676.1 MAG: peptidase C1 [candidate division KSB1 bacterium]